MTASRHRPARALSLAAGLLATALLAVGCGSQGDDDGFASGSGGGKKASVVFAEQPWADLEVEDEIATQILDKLGYDASIKKNLSVENAASAIGKGQIDAYLGNWWPSQKPTFEKLIDSGKVDVLSTMVTGTEYAPAVPGDVAKKLGISSLADLDKHAAAFGRKIYGIEAGTPGNETIQKAIDADAYGLGDWKLVESGTPAMLAQVEKSEKTGKPIVFLGWSPHWMTVQFKTVFLKDPQHVWAGAGEIRTLTREGFAKDNPEIAKFISNLRFTTDEGGQFYNGTDKEGKSPAEIAKSWIADNPDKVATFLDGVKDAHGKPASESLS